MSSTITMTHTLTFRNRNEAELARHELDHESNDKEPTKYGVGEIQEISYTTSIGEKIKYFEIQYITWITRIRCGGLRT